MHNLNILRKQLELVEIGDRSLSSTTSPKTLRSSRDNTTQRYGLNKNLSSHSTIKSDSPEQTEKSPYFNFSTRCESKAHILGVRCDECEELRPSTSDSLKSYAPPKKKRRLRKIASKILPQPQQITEQIPDATGSSSCSKSSVPISTISISPSKSRPTSYCKSESSTSSNITLVQLFRNKVSQQTSDFNLTIHIPSSICDASSSSTTSVTKTSGDGSSTGRSDCKTRSTHSSNCCKGDVTSHTQQSTRSSKPICCSDSTRESLFDASKELAVLPINEKGEGDRIDNINLNTCCDQHSLFESSLTIPSKYNHDICHFPSISRITRMIGEVGFSPASLNSPGTSTDDSNCTNLKKGNMFYKKPRRRLVELGKNLSRYSDIACEFVRNQNNTQQNRMEIKTVDCKLNEQNALLTRLGQSSQMKETECCSTNNSIGMSSGAAESDSDSEIRPCTPCIGCRSIFFPKRRRKPFFT